jgi:hypothetical protein
MTIASWPTAVQSLSQKTQILIDRDRQDIQFGVVEFDTIVDRLWIAASLAQLFEDVPNDGAILEHGVEC